MLLRKYIHKRLNDYYRQPHNHVVGSLPSKEPIEFKNLLNEWHWRRVFHKLYKEQQGQWLTPVELFRPYFSQIVANVIATEAMDKPKIHIVELGGGRGTNALEILNHLRSQYSFVYDRLQYTIMDVSPPLLELQKRVLVDDKSVDHSHLVDLREVDIFEVAEGKTKFLESSDGCTIILAMELLDNLPHDKLQKCSQTGLTLQTELYQDKKSNCLLEVGCPLDDPCIIDLLKTQPNYHPAVGSPRWVPTIASQLLKYIFDSRPNSSVILADFDYLPSPDIIPKSVKTRLSVKAEGEPLCTDMDDIDHECYLTAPPLCDILFPTEFYDLASYMEQVIEKQSLNGAVTLPWKVRVMKQNEFLSTFGPAQIEATTSRWTDYSPLIHDFSNCSVLYVSRK
jgi:hypothetical protein